MTDARQAPAADLALAAAAALLAGLGSVALPAGSALRLAVAAPALLLVPGYVALEAFVPRPGGRLRNLVLGVCVGPALIGLLALATAMVPGGFRAGSLVAMLTSGCVALAAVALARRWRGSEEPHADASRSSDASRDRTPAASRGFQADRGP